MSSVVAGQDRLATKNCQQCSSMRAHEQREFLFPESNSLIIKIVVLATVALFQHGGQFWILTYYQREKLSGVSVKGACLGKKRISNRDSKSKS